MGFVKNFVMVWGERSCKVTVCILVLCWFLNPGKCEEEELFESTTFFNFGGGEDHSSLNPVTTSTSTSVVSISSYTIAPEENDIHVFPSTTITATTNKNGHVNPIGIGIGKKQQQLNSLQRSRARGRHRNENINQEDSDSQETRFSTNGNGGREEKKNQRLLKFLRHFRFDFSKFDSTCMKRAGRGLPAPPVPNAYVSKFTRRRNRASPRNRYAMVLYECNDGFVFPPESADRMFCSRNKWVGPTPVCLPKATRVDEPDCSQCDQICSVDPNREGSIVMCTCYSGFEMSSNETCVDLDECALNNGGCSGICFNKLGSFQCFCPSGYQVGPDGKNCIDRNECLLRNGHGPCQDSCTNLPGSYTCSCERITGTRLAQDKHSCEDINECEEEGKFGCSHNCLNTFGNAFCACPKGLVLSTDDYKTCLNDNLDPFIPENLIETTTMVTTTTTTLKMSPLPPMPSINPLECPPGSEPDTNNAQICVEHEDCSVDNGGCEHNCVPSGSFRVCSCNSGYELLNETACVDINECDQENGGCDQDCVNIPGDYFCTCSNGFSLANDKRTCKGKVCEEPPTIPYTMGWDCESKDELEFLSKERPIAGTTCKLQCLPGYIIGNTEPSHLHHRRFRYDIEDSSTPTKVGRIVCNSDGQWSNLPHILTKSPCISTSCSKLPEPEHGSLFPDTCLQESVPLNTQCLILCSSGFYPKNGRMRTCSQGFRWFPEDNPLCILLPPTPRPYIHCPSDVMVDLKPGQNSAYVRIPQPQANMDWYRYVEADPPWAKNLEWDANAGIIQVVFTARSPISNDTATCHFKIHVVDREAPRVQGCPTSFEIRLSEGESSREVWWSEPKFTDNVKLHYVQQSHSPGQILSLGTHHITYVAGDAEANKARCSFTITIHSPEDYEMADYSYYSNGVGANSYRHVVICPNLKTGRWTLHYAYYLPPGCRYHSQGLYSKPLKQNGFQPNLIPRLKKRTLRTPL